MDNPLQDFMDDFKKKVAVATSPQQPDATTTKQEAAPGAAAASAVAPESKVDAEGFAVEPKALDTDGAGVCAEHPEPAEYQGIGNQFGVIEGESRSRLL